MNLMLMELQYRFQVELQQSLGSQVQVVQLTFNLVILSSFLFKELIVLLVILLMRLFKLQEQEQVQVQVQAQVLLHFQYYQVLASNCMEDIEVVVKR